jgi:hypothetical protein
MKHGEFLEAIGKAGSMKVRKYMQYGLDINTERSIMNHRLSIFGVVLIGVAVIFFIGNGLSEQEIEIRMEDGIPVVYNPKEPVPVNGLSSRLTLKEDFTIGKDTEDLNYIFSGLQHVQVDEDEYIYAADWKEAEIRVYDKNGKHVRSFGRKGQGPGEIGLPFYLGIYHGNKVVVFDLMNAKFIFFSREGKLLKEIPTGKYRYLRRFRVDSEGYFYAISRIFDEEKVTFEVKKFSPSFDPMDSFASIEVEWKPRVVQAFMPTQFIQLTTDESLVWLDFLEYEFTYMNRDGKPLRKIIKDCDPVKITDAQEQRLIQQTWGDDGVRPGYGFEVPKYFPETRFFYIDEEDRIYVRTFDYIEKEGDQLDRYDVFDSEGRYIAKFYHPRAETFQAIRKNKVYVRVEEEVYGADLLRRYSMIWE